jgi:hypothetical protein
MTLFATVAVFVVCWTPQGRTQAGAGSECEPHWDNAIGQPGLDVPNVTSLTVFDDGTGPALYAGGIFKSAGGAAVQSLARWDGSNWSAVGTDAITMIRALAVLDLGDGGGPALYASGSSPAAGGVFPGPSGFAKWDGQSWSPVGPTAPPTIAGVALDLAVGDLGDGPALYAGGSFSFVGTSNQSVGVAKWDGKEWSLPGAAWTSSGILTSGIHQFVEAVAVFDDGSGPALYAGGEFVTADGVAVGVARWNGSTWSPVGGWVSNQIRSMAAGDIGDGPALFIGGFFDAPAFPTFRDIAQWDGASWQPLGLGMDDAAVTALLVFDDGSGPGLYAGGSFEGAGGVPASRIARWDGETWSALGAGVNHRVDALAGFDDGSGPALYAGGVFTQADGLPASGIAAWQGCAPLASPWTTLGFALPGASGVPSLAGTGTLLTGSPGTLTLMNASPSAFSMLFIALTGTPLPFKCGTLVPVPVAFQLLLVTDSGGSIPLAWAAWPSGLSGLSLHVQYAIQDAAAICGVALSNALRAGVP